MSRHPFPARGERTPEEAWQAELDAMLAGDRAGADAASWRELRADVRSLAPSMTPEFEMQLSERLAKRASPAWSASPSRHPASHRARRPAWLRTPSHLGGGAAAAVLALMIAAAIIVAAPHLTPHRDSEATSSSSSARASGTTAVAPGAHADSAPSAGTATHGAVTPGAVFQGAVEHKEASTSSAPAAPEAAPALSAVEPAPGRKQQLAASISLAPTPGEVQATADRVAQLVVSDGGYVESSHVQVQQTGASEATLSLSLPSAKLSAALASLGGLAPVSAESQSLQDITSAYDSARQRLTDETAERQALLHALSLASTQGQIDSLRERLAQSRTAIAEAQSALQAVSRRSSNAEVEVTVLGDRSSGSEGLTLHRGLHEAGRVLTVTLVVLLVAVAVLLPLALLLLAGLSARSAWRKHRREGALDAP
jgi:hypothetical protein